MTPRKVVVKDRIVTGIRMEEPPRKSAAYPCSDLGHDFQLFETPPMQRLFCKRCGELRTV